jgi:hypothetical protein
MNQNSRALQSRRHQILTCWLCITLVLGCFQVVNGSSYKWEASLDRVTGIATSMETSTVPSHSNLFESLKKGRTSPRDMFTCYPLWLCHGSVTLGLLKAEPFSYGNNKKGIHVQDRIFGVNVLSFGQPTSSSLRLQWREKESHRRDQSSKSSVTVPIVGGFMASRRTPGGSYSGSLRFVLEQSSSNTYRIETGIANDYRPSLAGPPPVSTVRGWVYQSTQSLLHSYVMWRFHRFCYQQHGEESEQEL